MTPDAAALPAPAQLHVPDLDLTYVAHATGRFVDVVQAYLARQRPAPERAAPDPRSAAARDDRGDPRPVAAAESPLQRELSAGIAQGAIPKTIGLHLMTVDDVSVNTAVRAQSASQAAFILARMENLAAGANSHLRTVQALETQTAKSEARVKTASAEVRTRLAAVYRDPAVAAKDLASLLRTSLGPGHAARAIRTEPEILGQLRGGLIFRRAERRDALAAVGDLVKAIEQRARHISTADQDKLALEETRSAPARNRHLAEALRQHSHLTAIQTAVDAAAPQPDPLTAEMLHVYAQELAEAVTLGDMADPAARSLHPGFAAFLTDQMQRIGEVQSMLAAHKPSNAVATFTMAARVKEHNIDAAEHLQREGHLYPAQRAAMWANEAHQVMAESAKTILSDFTQHNDARQLGILAHAHQFHTAVTAQAQGASSHSVDMAHDGHEME